MSLPLFALLCAVVTEPMLPMLQPQAQNIASTFVKIAPGQKVSGQKYFDAPIPKKIHQIWFGRRSAMCTEGPELWQQFAETFGYDYHLWSEQDDDVLALLMPDKNFELMVRMRDCGTHRVAADVLRLSLLQHFGGIYSDIDIGPPLLDETFVDLADLFPMRGLVIINENFAQNVGNTAVFFGNNFMAASPEQPLIRHLVRNIGNNVDAFIPGTTTSSGPICANEDNVPFLAGPFYLNRSLGGVATLLPITLARRYSMVRDGKWDIQNPASFTFDEIPGDRRWGCPDSPREIEPGTD